ncbi:MULTISPECIES: phosphotransferase family protein [Gordonia]|jgi:aminoglycoside phosphotransferase (APT) family kinase protein|uniref:Aminoglycoside phosphotransferase n=1 Tax=Gordonia alkanivorans CGMCC 6845 TaxID=1423140 RepID=W9D8I6_9ACTN|nr:MULTISPECIES: phosphotransferase family protein [Gordonia]ETA04634.1 aminoglycoside phosphotransferase [Gordonia alkanivorans CGMCC 6845]MDH3008740.1 phosphotransferase family protein [Gordonia alkanivorans]MDH3012647.1 phosphotransferase family protein [Gordonia alkanivorans]MDH3017691.1 phosphotransferase family protein [Gordonia alkanivorans]MDH3022042.1 phosphotransferase family protein [Gordonia alkanivorans]
MADQVTEAREVREEDAFDVEAVAAWLRTAAPDVEGLDAVPEVRQFAGGASNLTFLLRYPTRDLILRRAPRGTKARGAHDMRREYRIQSELAGVIRYIAPMIAFCDDDSVLGADFYVMGRIDGVIPRKEWPADVPLDADQARQLCFNFIDTLVEVHSVDPSKTGLGDLGKGLGYVRRQVDGWTTRFRNAHTDDVPDFEEAMSWLAENQPEDVANCIIHNDFKLDNVVLDKDDPTRVIGILDWEMATLGDPLMDLAGSMAYWIQADDTDELQLMRRVPTNMPGMITRAEFVERYCERMGFEMSPERWRWYEAFGLFRAVVIAQQIYYRFYHGQTTNKDFERLGFAVGIIGKRLNEIVAG